MTLRIEMYSSFAYFEYNYSIHHRCQNVCLPKNVLIREKATLPMTDNEQTMQMVGAKKERNNLKGLNKW